MPLDSLTEYFSIAGFFAVFNNIYSKPMEDTQPDIDLLQSVSTVFQRLSNDPKTETYSRKVSQIFQIVLSVIYMIKSDSSLLSHQYAPRSSIPSYLSVTETETYS